MATKRHKKKSKVSRISVEPSMAIAMKDDTVLPAREVKFEYLKSGQFRVLHADGFHGGLTPSGRKVHLAIFNERNPISKTEVFELSPNGTLGKIKSKTSRDGIVREVEASILMDLTTAVALHQWLERVFMQAEKREQRKRKKV